MPLGPVLPHKEEGLGHYGWKAQLYVSFRISGSLTLLWGSQKSQEAGGKWKMRLGCGVGVQRKGCYLDSKYEEDTPGLQRPWHPRCPSPAGCSSHLTCSHLAYSQACWGSGKGPRQG